MQEYKASLAPGFDREKDNKAAYKKNILGRQTVSGPVSETVK